MLNPKQPHYIIAFDASEGTIDVISRFFDHTFFDEISYVILPHVLPGFKSELTNLLGRHPKLQLNDAEDNTWVECNKVYLIPRDKFMTINNGRLYLTEKTKEKLPGLTVGAFFNSIAYRGAKDTIDIILWGAASGAPAVESIKRANVSGSEFHQEELYSNQRITNMKEELSGIKYVRPTHDATPDKSNEDMQSFMEKLISTNEGMHTTNEEMKSVNKQLKTINSDYQLKNKMLVEINDDLNNYFRSNINGQLFVNTDLKLVKFSPGAARHIDIRDTDIGKPIDDISTNIKFLTIESDVKEVLAYSKVIEREVEAANGRWYQMTTMPYIRQIDNKTDGAIISFNDITDLKLIQLELDRTNKSLININADLDNFVHTASHDLLGPLANIKLSIDVMNQLEAFRDPQLHKFMEIINGSVKLFVDLVREMATIGKVENEMSAMKFVDVNELINELTLSIDNKIVSTKTLIIKDIAVTRIYFSKKNLRSLLYNLISNAIKFKSSDRDPEIIISTRAEHGYAVLTVKDNGIGIPETEFNNIFKMYGRLHKDVEGQGIGLYLIKKIINASGGKVVVESEQSKGSIFTIYFKSETVSLHNMPLDNYSIAK